MQFLREQPYINLDMDGVSADFDLHYLQTFGHPHKSVPDTEMWDNINSKEDFFATVPLMSDVHILFDFASQFQHGWLTACPKHDFMRVARQKREWNHLNGLMRPNTGFIPSPGGSSKPAYLQHLGAILIDDFDRNILAWREAGGTGILYQNINQAMGDLERALRNWRPV